MRQNTIGQMGTVPCEQELDSMDCCDSRVGRVEPGAGGKRTGSRKALCQIAGCLVNGKESDAHESFQAICRRGRSPRDASSITKSDA